MSAYCGCEEQKTKTKRKQKKKEMQEKRILGNESLVLLGVGATGVISFFFSCCLFIRILISKRFLFFVLFFSNSTLHSFFNKI